MNIDMFNNDWKNPYIAGAPVTDSKLFFGRRDITDQILLHVEKHHLVLYGQRRIGKTSILRQLNRYLPATYLVIYFDLEGQNRLPLGRFLVGLARNIASAISQECPGVAIRPDRKKIEEDPESFETQFITEVLNATSRDLLICLDEFDTLQLSVPEDSSGDTFINVLFRLFNQPHIRFIFSVGAYDGGMNWMSDQLTSLLKTALFLKVSFFDRITASQLIQDPVQDRIQYQAEAVDAIIRKTSGHPYFIQLYCHELFSNCQKNNSLSISLSDVFDTQNAVIELGSMNLKYLWDETSSQEKWLLMLLSRQNQAYRLIGDIAYRLCQFGFWLDPVEIHKLLEGLQNREILDEQFSYRVELFEDWVRQNWNLYNLQAHLPTDPSTGNLARMIPQPMRPPQQPGFVGRKSEIEHCLSQLEQYHHLFIGGMHGIGKTSLGAEIAARRAPPERIFWHEFKKNEEVYSLIWKLAGFLALRGAPLIWNMLAGSHMESSFRQPPNILLESLLNMAIADQIFICLDNLENVQNDNILLDWVNQLIRESEKGRIEVVLISAQNIRNLHFKQSGQALTGLTIEDTRAMFTVRNVVMPDEYLVKFFESTGGNPQVLSLIIENLHQGKKPEVLIQQMTNSEDIENYLVQSVSAGLEQEEQEVFEALAIFGNYPVGREIINQLLDDRAVGLLLNRMVDRYLVWRIEVEDERRYFLPPMIQRFFYANMGTGRRKMLHQKAATLFSGGFHNPIQAAQHFSLARELLDAYQVAISNVWTFINYGEAKNLLEILSSIPVASLTNEQAAARNLAMGEVQAFLGNSAEALFAYETVYQEASMDLINPERAAEACLRIGHLLQDDHPNQALSWLKKGDKVLAKAQAPGIKAALRIRMGRILAYQGKNKQALVELKVGLSMLTESASRLRISALGNLGNIYCSQGDIQRGQEYYHQAKEDAINLHDYWSLIEVNHNISYENEIAGNWTEALTGYQEEYHRAIQLGSVDQQLRALLHLGNLSLKTGDKSNACRQLLELVEKARDKHPHYLIYGLSSLVDFYLRQNDPVQAEKALQATENLVKELGHIPAEVEPEFYRNQAGVLLMKGLLDQAFEKAQKAYEVGAAQESEIEQGLGWKVIGQVQAARGRIIEADAAFRTSLAKLAHLNPYEAARTQAIWGIFLIDQRQDEYGKVLIQQAEETFTRLKAAGDLHELQQNTRQLEFVDKQK